MAGLVSFISPCVLPLVPAYIGYMGGRATNEASKSEREKFGTFIHGIFFVLGFTFFFVGFGLLTSAASSFLNDIGIDIPTLLTRLGGVAVIFFGLYVMKFLDPIFSRLLDIMENWKEKFIEPLVFTLVIVGLLMVYFYWSFGADGVRSMLWAALLLLGLLALFRKSLEEATSLADFWYLAIETLQVALISDTRQMSFGGKKDQEDKNGYGASFGLGIVFSAGWTPCIGPIYGAVLALAADASTTGSLLNAAVLLTAYSLGLGIPFLLTALAFNQSTAVMTRLKRNMRKVELFSGALLLIIGVLILSGGLQDISARFASDGDFSEFSFRLEECTAGTFNGRIGLSSYPECLGSGIEKLETLYIASVRFGDQSPYVFAPAPENATVGLAEGNLAPNFTLTNIDGETVSLSDYRGQAVLINFWATWCGPCRQEMPHFNRIFLNEQARGFVVLAINEEESLEQAQEFAAEFELDFPVLLDPDGEIGRRQYNVRGLPTSYLVDGNGIIVAAYPGILSEEDLLNDLSQFSAQSDDAVFAIE